VNAEIEAAEREYDLNKAAELKYGKLPELQKQLDAEEKPPRQKGGSLLRDKVTEEEIARSSPAGRASPWPSSWRASAKSCCTCRTCCTSA
jgi:hypothetical protein